MAKQTLGGGVPVEVLADDATRKPLLFSQRGPQADLGARQFVGLLLLRFAERQLSSLLFHDPPRSTRAEPGSAYPFTNTISRKTRLRQPHVSAWDTWPNQLMTYCLIFRENVHQPLRTQRLQSDGPGRSPRKLMGHIFSLHY